MARNQFEDALRAALQGGMQGYQTAQTSGNEIQKALMLAKIKESMTPREWKPTTEEEYMRTKDVGVIKPMNPLVEARTIKQNKLLDLQTQNLENKQEEAKVVKNKQSENVLNSALDFKNTLKEVKKGSQYFGAAGPIPTLNPWGYERKEWEANINKLLSQKVVDLMNNMKQASRTGATGFGQLNRSELMLLQNASTALNRGLSPEQALKYLGAMEKLSDKIINGGIEQATGIKQLGGIPAGYERRRYKDGTIKDVKIGS
jgi:hypothetical protein